MYYIASIHIHCYIFRLIRAAYEEKVDYFASLAANVLKSAHRALDFIQKTDEYVKLIILCKTTGIIMS